MKRHPGQHGRRVPDELVAAMHRDYMAGMTMIAVARKWDDRHRGTLRRMFLLRGLPLRHESRSKHDTDGRFARFTPATRAEIEREIAMARKMVIPARLRLDWRHWSLERRAQFMARLRAWLQPVGSRPETPFSANVVPFDCGTREAHAIVARLNEGRNSRTKNAAIKACSQGVIWRGQLWFWTPKAGYVHDRLIDGQHRLLAIVQAQCTVRLMVTFGVPAKVEGKEMTAMDAVDRGRPRSVADQLKIQHQLKHGSIIAGITRVLGMLCNETRTRRFSVGETLQIYRAFQGPVDWLIEHRPKGHGLRTAGVLAGFAFAMAVHDEWTRKRFLEVVDEGAAQEVPEDSAMRHLHTFLTGEDAVLLMRGTDRGVAELVLEALRNERKGAQVTRLQLSQEGLDHFQSLQKERVEKIAAMFLLPEPGGAA